MSTAGSPSLAVVGLGLIGGSVARRATASGWSVGWIDPGVEEGAVRSIEPGLRRIEGSELGASDLVLLSTPTGVAIDILHQLEFGTAVVTSVCSVMQPLSQAASDRSVRFVGGHPMAGREHKGWEQSLPSLFEDRAWFREDPGADSEASALVDRLIHDCGASVFPIAPPDHDCHAAVASHLPQLLSSALAAVIEHGEVPEPFLGPGLRTFLRLAGSSWSMWEPVYALNSEAVADSHAALAKMIRKVMSGEGEEVFDRANRLYESLGK